MSSTVRTYKSVPAINYKYKSEILVSALHHVAWCNILGFDILCRIL